MSGTHARTKTILVVDDSPVVLEMTRALLESEGYRVVTRSRGAGTVEAVIREKPDLVLLDVKMPRFNGDTIASILMRSSLERRSIVLFYSSCPAAVLEEKARQAGADGYIQKTGDSGALISQVHRWLGGTNSPGRSLTPDVSPHARVARGEPPTASPTVSAGRVASRPLVLFVDDDELTLAAYRRVQRGADFDGEFVSSSQDALGRILSRNPPDIVVCDLHMPEPDGRQIFQRAMRHDPTWQRRFVFVSGATSMGHLAPFLATVGQQVLQKPVEFEALNQAVRFASIAAKVFNSMPVGRPSSSMEPPKT